MKWKDLSDFTCDELSYFTCDDLTLGKLELLEKAHQDEIVPDEIVKKIYQLCDDVFKEIPSANISLPTDKRFTLKNANEILNAVNGTITTYKSIPEPVRQKIAKGMVKCIEVLVNLYNK